MHFTSNLCSSPHRVLITYSSYGHPVYKSSMKQTKQVFLTVALFAHGYAGIIANNGLEYDEKLVAKHLEQAWNGALLAAAQEEQDESERR